MINNSTTITKLSENILRIVAGGVRNCISCYRAKTVYTFSFEIGKAVNNVGTC